MGLGVSSEGPYKREAEGDWSIEREGKAMGQGDRETSNSALSPECGTSRSWKDKN